MFTTRFARNTACFGATFLVAIFALVALLPSSQAEFETLSDEAMAQFLGGKKTQGNLIQSQSGSRANCNWPSSCPTGQFTYRRTIYSCFTCEPGDIEYSSSMVYKKIISWCDNTLPTECPYRQFGRNRRSDCSYSLGSYC